MSTSTITPKKPTNESEMSEDYFYLQLLNDLTDGVYFVDRGRRITYWNRGAERITGYSAAEVLGSRCADGILKHVNAQGTCLCTDGCPLAATMEDKEHRTADVFLHHKGGHRVPVRVHSAAIFDHDRRVIGCAETFQDLSDRQADLMRIKELEEVAFLDVLTGIANRRHLASTMEARFAEFVRDSRRFGLILLDVDHFKRFNDEYGHETGDLVLQMVARNLSLNCRPYDTIGRWGGEEFLVVVGNADQEPLQLLAERIRVLVAASSLDVGGVLLAVTISLGATVVREGDDLQSILRRVDELLYTSKNTGRKRATFDPPH